MGSNLTPDWSDDMLKLAVQLWAEGLSASQIAAQLGVSRSAVAGKAFRNRALFPERRQGRPSETLRRVVEKLRGPHASVARVKAEPSVSAPRMPRPQPAPVVLPAGWTDPSGSRFDLDQYRHERFAPVAFVSLLRGQCHFPLQAFEAKGGPDMPCCGAPAAGADRYCAEHRQLMTGGK